MKKHLCAIYLGSVSFVFLLALTPLTNAHAETVLIDCDLPSGPYYQVHIVSQVDSMKLREYAKTGEIYQRELMPWEWTRKRIKLTTGRLTDQVVLQKVGPGWMLKVETPRYKYEGFADCDHH